MSEFLNLFVARIRDSTDDAICEEPCGFWSFRERADQIHAVRQVYEKKLAKGINVFCIPVPTTA